MTSSGFLTKGDLPRVSRQSFLSTNDVGDNEMIPGAVHRSPDIYLMAEDNLGKPQLGDRLMKAANGVPNLEMKLVQPESSSGREKEGKEGVVRWSYIYAIYLHVGKLQRKYLIRSP